MIQRGETMLPLNIDNSTRTCVACGENVDVNDAGLCIYCDNLKSDSNRYIIPFPSKKYQIIYADPPWQVTFSKRSVRPKQIELPYKIMSLEEICELPVRRLIDPKGCHLFLWTTHTWLPSAFKVMEEWGFKYHCCLTWDKGYGFTPFSFMLSTEFCLYGQVKGSWLRPQRIGLKTLIHEHPTKHSRKPNAMRDLIVEFCGDLPRIELFARERVEGWDAWGDEI